MGERSKFEGASHEYMVECYYMEADENSRLRKILLALASRPEITAETRKLLARDLKDKDMAIVHGLREDEMEEVRDTLKVAQKLIDHVRKVVDDDRNDVFHRIEAIWYQQADSYTNQLQGRIQETQSVCGRDIADLEEGR